MQFNIGNITYTWGPSYFLAWFCSYEKNTEIGTVRYLGDKLFYIKQKSGNRVDWFPVEKDYTLEETFEPMSGRKYMGEIVDRTIREKWFTENLLRK